MCGARDGVVRVYSQQCGYVLSDTEAAKASMRALVGALRSSGSNGLEVEGAHKGRSVPLSSTALPPS